MGWFQNMMLDKKKIRRNFHVDLTYKINEKSITLYAVLIDWLFFDIDL